MQVAKITAQLSADFDAKGKREAALYERKLNELRTKAQKRDLYKAKLGGDFDPRAFNAMERELKQIDREQDKVRRGGSVLGKSTKNLGGSFLALGKSMAGPLAALGSIAGAFSLVKSSVSELEALAKGTAMVARTTGMDTKAASEWVQVAKIRGVEAKQLNMGFVALARNMRAGAQGTKASVDAFKELGVSQAELKRGDASEVLGDVADAFAKMPDGANKAALAQKLFSRQAATLLPLVNKGSDALQEQLDTVDKYGAALDEGGVKKAFEAVEAQRKLDLAWRGAKITLGEAVTPLLTTAADKLGKFVREMREGRGQGGEFVDTMKDLARSLGHIGGFLHDHTTLIKIAAAAWVTYRAAALGAAGASKAAALAGALGGRGGAGAAGRIAGGAAAGSVLPGIGTIAGAAAAALAIGSISAKAGHAGKQLKEFAQRSSDAIKSRDIGRIREMARSMDYLADHSGNAQKGFQDLRRRTDGAADALEDWRNKVRRVNRDVGHSFEVMKTVTQGNLGDIRRFTRRNAEDIKDALGKNTTEGRKALARNFALAAQAVRDRMRETGKTTRAGTAEIERLMVKSLTSMGLSRQQAVAIRDHGTLQATSNRVPGGGGGQRDRAMGGWIGRRGQKGGDTVPIMAGEGEAVLSGPQQQVVEGLLGQGFLDQLFTTVQRPHYFARGGRVGKFASGGIAGAIGAADKLDAAHFPYVWGGGHSGSPAPFGPMDCSGAVSYVLQHGGVDIPTMVSGQLAGAGQAGPGGMTVYANPVHTFMRIGNRYFGTSGSNPGGGAGWFPDPGEAYKSRFAVRHFGPGDGMSAPTIRPPVIGGDGSIVALGNQALGVSAAGANSAVARALSRMGLGAGDAGDPGPTPRGGYSKAALMRLWVTAGGPKSAARMAAAIAMAESRGDPNASNTNANGSIDRGLWQINSVHGAQSTFDPVGNARSAIGISGGGSNWGPWTTYNSGAYRSFLARGGFVKAAKGLHSQDPRARRRPPRGRYNPAPPTVKGILGLKLAPGYGVDVYDGQWDIFRPTDDTAGPKLTRAADRLDLAMVRAITDTPTNFQDDLNIARWQEHLWAQVYFGRVARHAPGSKIRAAAEKLNDAKATIQGLFGSIYDQNEGGKVAPDGPNGPEGPADVSADMQAIIDQTNVKLAASQANVTALQGINTAFGSSGDIGAGGFANAFQAGAGAPRVTIYQTNQMMHPSDPQVLATLANATVSGMSLQSSVATTRSKVGL